MPEERPRYRALRAIPRHPDAQLVAAAQGRPQQCERTLWLRGAPSRTAADRERTCGDDRGPNAGVAVAIDAADAKLRQSAGPCGAALIGGASERRTRNETPARCLKNGRL